MRLDQIQARSRVRAWGVLFFFITFLGSCALLAACGGEDVPQTDVPADPYPDAPKDLKTRTVFENEQALLGTWSHKESGAEAGRLEGVSLTLYGNGTHRFTVTLAAAEAGAPATQRVNEGTWFTEGADRLFLSHKRSDGKPAARREELELRIGEDGLSMASDPGAPPLKRE